MKVKFGILAGFIITGLLASCVTGDYMAMKPSENVEVLGIVQTTFNVTGAFRDRKSVV